MAYTKILVIHNRLDKCVDYALNEEKTSLSAAIGYALNRDKTEQTCFESAINCDVDTAYRDMLETKRRWGKEERGRKGYHIIQSFAPGEVTPEEAHAVGVALAERLLGGRYEVVVATHLNKAHLHSHLVFNSVSFVDGKMYRDTFRDYYGDDGEGIRGTSDAICQERGLRAKGMSGQRVATQIPYGYLKGEDGKLVEDEDTAPVVRLIFQLCAEGNGPGKIARILREREIITPGTLAFRRTGYTRNYDPDRPCHWIESSIVNILGHKEYLGHTVNFKTTKKSFKSKKTLENPEDKQMVFENTHPALITQETWDIVQKNRQQRRRPTKQDEAGLFSGLAFCADCGHVMHLNRAVSMTREQENYTCGIYKQKKGKCTAHFIRTVVLEKLVLENLRKVIAYANDYEDEFVRQIMENKLFEQMEAQADAKRLLEQQTRRVVEIDTIIKRLYEDNVGGKLSNERFAKMSGDYEQEQRTLETSTAELRKIVEQAEQQTVNIKSFLKLAHSYYEPTELTPAMLREFVDKVVIHAPDKSSGHRVQQIDIHYNFVGEIDLSHETITRQTA